MTKAKRAKLIKDAFYKATDAAVSEHGKAKVFAPSARIRGYAKSRGLSVTHLGESEYLLERI